MNQDVSGIRKLFWKEVRGKVDSYYRIRDGNGRLALFTSLFSYLLTTLGINIYNF